MKIVVIGAAGLIGKERIKALLALKKEYFGEFSISVFDTNMEALIKNYKSINDVSIINSDKDWSQIKPDWTFICVPHDISSKLIKQAFEVGSNVLVEKPLGRNLEECEDIIKHKPNHLKLNVGFNYRFYDGIEQALKDCKNKKFGDLISVNMILGHGNSPDTLNTWKLDPIKCGGCLVDPGVHLLDLVLQIAGGNVKVDKSKIWKGFWKNGIEEEAHLIMSDESNTIFNVQVSLNRWRSTFRLEINGTEGYGIIEGRGKSYGPQSYRFGRRWGWQSGKSQADSEEWIVKNMINDLSFLKETQFLLGMMPVNLDDYIWPSDHSQTLKVMQLLEKCKNKENNGTLL